MSSINVTAAPGATFSALDFATGVEAISRFGVPGSTTDGGVSAVATHPVTGEELKVVAYGNFNMFNGELVVTHVSHIDFYIGGKLQGTVDGPGLTAALSGHYSDAIATDWSYTGTDADDVTAPVMTTPWGPFTFEPSSDNVFKLNGGNDNFYAGAGNDTMNGGEGNDTLLGADGNDVIYGGSDNDVIVGGTGSDLLFGGTGDDLVQAGGDHAPEQDLNANAAWGGAGSDTVVGGDGADMLGGGTGGDVVYGNGGNDIVYGGKSTTNDPIGADTIHAGEGNDTVYAGSHDDVVHGDAGSDVLFGGDGNDAIDGGDGGDQLWGGAGDDELLGGGGADTFSFATGAGDDVIVDFLAAEGDRLDLQGQTYSESTNESGDVVLALSGGGTVTLSGVAALEDSWII